MAGVDAADELSELRLETFWPLDRMSAERWRRAFAAERPD
jgi:hypothetical protein